MRNWKLYLMASAAVGCFGIAETASAQVVYGGGATFPAPVYRQLFDCHAHPIDGAGVYAAYPISPKCASSTGVSSGHEYMWILYAGVGSGGGKRALRNHNGSSSATTGLGPVNAAVPYLDSVVQPSYGYPSVQFIGSDDPWTKADADAYAGSAGEAVGGGVIQMPALAGAVVVAFNGKDGNGNALALGAAPTGAAADKAALGYPGNYSGLKLTRKALCGIFTGHITAWNDPELTSANGGVIGTGQITVIRRSDGSGTNFLFTQALYRQCQGVSGPINTADALSGTPHVRSWEFKFPDTTASACPDVFYRAANTIAWPGVSACGTATPLPADAVFTGAAGNGGVKTAIENTNGAIGYSTTDYSQPVLASGMQVANIQSEFDLNNNTGAFQWPSPTRITNAMAAASPIFPDDNAIANPVNWSTQGQVPNPGTPESYPLVGFTWLDFYQCYDTSGDRASTHNNMLFYLGFHYYDSHAEDIIKSAGFAPIPSTWRDPIIPLLTSAPSRMSGGFDSSNPVCASRPGA